MADPKDSKPRVKLDELDGDVPKQVRDFVVCNTDRVELDLNDSSWLPRPQGVPEGMAPDLEFQQTGANQGRLTGARHVPADQGR